MVWRRMGLLDDAIRDHLELKRLRGADPGEVAREQKEALEPVFGEEDGVGTQVDVLDSAAGEEDGQKELFDSAYAEQDGQRPPLDSLLAEDEVEREGGPLPAGEELDLGLAPTGKGATPVATSPVGASDPTPDAAGGAQHSNVGHVSQETAEFDVQSVLDKHGGAALEHPSPEHALPEHDDPAGPAIEDSTEGGHSAEERNEGSLEW